MKDILNIKNIRRGPVTTVIGVLIILTGLAILFFPVDNTYSLPLIGIGVFLAFVNDKPGKGTAVALIMLIMSSCVTYDKCVQKYGTATDTVKVTVRDTVEKKIHIRVPADSARLTVNIDSLLRMRVQDTITAISSRAKARVLKSPDNNTLHIDCDCPPADISDTILVPVEVQADCPPVQQFKDKPQGKIEKFWHWYRLFAAFALPVLLLMIIKFKR